MTRSSNFLFLPTWENRNAFHFISFHVNSIQFYFWATFLSVSFDRVDVVVVPFLFFYVVVVVFVYLNGK